MEELHTTMTKTVNVTLKVDARGLYERKYPPTLEEFNLYCSLFDDSERYNFHREEKLEDYITEVHPGEIVKWAVESKWVESEYAVEIDSIVYAYAKESEIDFSEMANFFDLIALCSRNGSSVEGKVKDDIKSGLYHFYWINFRIYKDGESHKDYSIDPRLKIQ